MPRFEAKAGTPYTETDAAIVGPAILDVIRECGGAVNKEDIVAAARHPESPLHAYVFNKTQAEAAEAYYRNQGGKLLRSFQVVWQQNGEERRADLTYYVTLVNPEEAEDDEPLPGMLRQVVRERGHIAVVTMMERPHFQEQQMAKLQTELATLQRKMSEFEHLIDFSSNFGRAYASIRRWLESR